MATALVFLADGFEELEAVAIIDVLRRAGVLVSTCGVTGREVIGAHNVTLCADGTCELLALEVFSAVILPGRMPGVSHLKDDLRVRLIVDRHISQGRWIGAICAAPWALASWGLLKGKNVTCYPGFQERVAEEGAHIVHMSVVVDGQFITSQGPGTAVEFALKLAEVLVSGEKSAEMARAMMVAGRSSSVLT